MDLAGIGSFIFTGGTGTFSFTITAPVSLTLSFNPPSANILDNSPIGTPITTVTATLSDGSVFMGSLVITDPSGIVVANGMMLVTGRALTSADDGMHTINIRAVQ